MTNTAVDLSELKVGDTVFYRDGTKARVIDLKQLQGTEYCYKVNTRSFTMDGYYWNSRRPSDLDIIAVHHSVQQESIKCGDLEQRLANQIELTQSINSTLQEVKAERDALQKECESLRALLSEQVRDYVTLMDDLQRVMRTHFPS